MEKINKKILPPSCLFCVNSSTSVRKFKITEDYGGGNTIRYDLTNFLGHQIEAYLKDDDLLCSNCMNFFENMAYTKRRLIDFLRNRDESADIKMQGFNDIWKGFTKFAVTLVKFNPNDTEETWDSEVNRCLTPNPLVHSYSEPYNHAYEREFLEMGQNHSKSAAHSETYSETDSEVGRLFRGNKRKRRGHNWSRRKGEQKSRTSSRTYPDYSYLNEDYHRNCYSTQSSRKRRARSEDSVRRPSKKKPRSASGNPLKTRSVSRLEGYLAKVTAERESDKYYCSDVNCSIYFESLDNLVLHKIYDHNIIARFKCNQCTSTYTTKQELIIHNRKHDTEVLHCFQCRAECQGTENLQAHLIKHQEYSIECKFCYLSFLSKSELVDHCSREHKGRKKKVRERISSIFRSIVNEHKISDKRVDNNNQGEKEFQSRVLCVEKSPSPDPVWICEPAEPTVNISAVTDTEIAPVLPILTPISVNDSTPISVSDSISATVLLSEVLIDSDTANDVVNLCSDNSPENCTMREEFSDMSEQVLPMDVDNLLHVVSNIHTELGRAQMFDNLQLHYYKPVVILNRLDDEIVDRLSTNDRMLL